MAEQTISQGAIDAIFNDPDRAASQFPVPVLQCLQLKTLEAKGPEGGAPQRYRVILSDMRNYVQCMLATQANTVVHSGQLGRGSVVRLKQYQASTFKDKKIMIALDLEVLSQFGNPERLGDPKALEVKNEPQSTTIGGAGFYGAKSEPTEETKSQVQRQLGARSGPIGGGSGHGGSTIYPIEALSPYGNKWTIKVRVTSKTDIKTWHKSGSEGKLFSCNLLDESGEIRATAFNNDVDQFYDLLQEGSVYYISTPCKVQIAKKQFSNLPNDYELTFERDTVIEKAEDQSSVPQLRFNFSNIQGLQDVEKDATVDVIGVLKDAQEVEEIKSKTTQKPYNKRELTLVDDTGYSVRVTIWGKTATEFDANPGSVVAFKGTRVSDFGGRSLSLLSSGTMAVDPDIPEAHKLKGWYDSQGPNTTFASHNNMSSIGAATGRKDDTKTVQQVKTENLGFDDAAYFTLKATIVHIRHENFAYPACSNEKCNKKVVEDGDGWQCEKCNVKHKQPQYRYIMSINVSDHTGNLWLSCFDESARLIMGKTADELVAMQAVDDKERFDGAFEAANCRQLTFRCRAKMDTYGDQQRIRYQVMSVAPLDYKSEGHKLAELIQQMNV